MLISDQEKLKKSIFKIGASLAKSELKYILLRSEARKQNFLKKKQQNNKIKICNKQ